MIWFTEHLLCVGHSLEHLMCIINITLLMNPGVSPVIISVFKILKLKPKKLITLSRLYSLKEAEAGFECKRMLPSLVPCYVPSQGDLCKVLYVKCRGHEHCPIGVEKDSIKVMNLSF